MTEPPVRLVGIGIENLRGFDSAHLDLSRDVLVLVGPNNSGKTSLLRMLDWIFNEPMACFDSARPVDGATLALLRPAREARRRARRLTLYVRVLDGRRHGRFKCVDGIAQLRIGLRLSPRPGVRVNLGPPARKESTAGDDDAYELLQELRSAISFRLIPATRDAASASFAGRLESALRAKLEERTVHARQAGAPLEYRRMSNALGEVTEVAESLAEPLWAQMRAALPAGLADSGFIRVNAEPSDLVDWLISKLRFTLSTGPHDHLSVPPTEVGSGLQSLLELSLAESAAAEDGTFQITALEEPEAFLHPAAQRTLARKVFEDVPGQRILSTHSPILVEEARFGDIVLVHDRAFVCPSPQTEEKRQEINTALLTRYGAELVFARSALLVEGEGDREFFESLRRRLARVDASGLVDRLVVVPTGSNTAFGPWLQLLDSYRQAREAPIEFIALVDGDAATEIRQAFESSSIDLSGGVRGALERLSEVAEDDDLEQRLAAARLVNQRSRADAASLAISPGDLEQMICARLAPETVAGFAERFDLHAEDGGELARTLGTKCHPNPKKKNALKAPWTRAVMGREIPWDEVSDDVRFVLRRWLEGAMTKKEVSTLMRKADRLAAENPTAV